MKEGYFRGRISTHDVVRAERGRPAAMASSGYGWKTDNLLTALIAASRAGARSGGPRSAERQVNDSKTKADTIRRRVASRKHGLASRVDVGCYFHIHAKPSLVEKVREL